MAVSRPDDSSDNRRAMLSMATGMSFLSFNDVLVRWVGADLPVGQMMVIRGVAMIAIFTAIFYARKTPFSLAGLSNRWSVARALCELTATYMFLTAILIAPIATVTTLVFTAPIIMTAIAGPVYGEKVGPWRWAAVLAGFGGVALITAPTDGDFNPALLLPLGVSVLVVARDIMTRRVDDSLPTSTVAMTTAIVVTLGGFLSLPWGWEAPTPINLGMLTLAGLFVGCSYILYVTAIRIGELSLISPFRYSIVIWAALFGWLIWGEQPGPLAMLGGALIVGSGLLILYRERVNRLRLAR